jgi:hypothetical protein
MRPVSATELLASASVAAMALTGCGGGAPAQPSLAERQWIDNAAGLIADLGDGVVLSASGGNDIQSARRALHDESDLYAMVIAYTRFGGCRQTMLNLGAPNARLRSVEQALETACRRFERASALFTVAVERDDANVLLTATRTALKASPLLYRAEAELNAVRASRG